MPGCKVKSPGARIQKIMSRVGATKAPTPASKECHARCKKNGNRHLLSVRSRALPAASILKCTLLFVFSRVRSGKEELPTSSARMKTSLMPRPMRLCQTQWRRKMCVHSLVRVAKRMHACADFIYSAISIRDRSCDPLTTRTSRRSRLEG